MGTGGCAAKAEAGDAEAKVDGLDTGAVVAEAEAERVACDGTSRGCDGVVTDGARGGRGGRGNARGLNAALPLLLLLLGWALFGAAVRR